MIRPSDCPPLPLDRIACRTEQGLERLADPAEGLIMLETGVDVHPLLREIAEKADVRIGPDGGEATHYWHYGEGRNYATNAHHNLRSSFRKHGKIAIDALEASEQLIGQFRPQFVSDKPLHSVRHFASVLAVVQRRIILSPAHVDHSKVFTLWLGATKPGLMVFYHEQWHSVNDVPSGHALMWRGDFAEHQGQLLPPTRHAVSYRSVVRRVALIH